MSYSSDNIVLKNLPSGESVISPHGASLLKPHHTIWCMYPAIWLGNDLPAGTTLDIPTPERCHARPEYDLYSHLQNNQGTDITPTGPLPRFSAHDESRVQEALDAHYPRVYSVSKSVSPDDGDAYTKARSKIKDEALSLDRQMSLMSRFQGETRLYMLTCTIPGKGRVVLLTRETEFLPSSHGVPNLEKSTAVFTFTLDAWLSLGSDPRRWWWRNLEELRLRKNVQATLSVHEYLAAQTFALTEAIPWADSPLGMWPAPHAGHRECPICMHKYTPAPAASPTMLSCRHVFCEFCIKVWLQTSPLCPLCRDDSTAPPVLQSTAGFWQHRARLQAQIVGAQRQHIKGSTTIRNGRVEGPVVKVRKGLWRATLKDIADQELNTWRDSWHGSWICRPEINVGFQVLDDWVRDNAGRSVGFADVVGGVGKMLREKLEKKGDAFGGLMEGRHKLLEKYGVWFLENVVEVLVLVVFYREMDKVQRGRIMPPGWEAEQRFLDQPVPKEQVDVWRTW